LERTLNLINLIPKLEPVAILLRHSARDDVEGDSPNFDMSLNELGVRMCRELGAELKGMVASIRTSPARRCMQTASLICEFSGFTENFTIDRVLGGPGIYVLDENIAGKNWEKKGNSGVIQHLVSKIDCLPGMANPISAAKSIVDHMLTVSNCDQGLHLFISHDSIMTPTVARALGINLPKKQWPNYLDAAVFWRDKAGCKVRYLDYFSTFH
jgi:hypothetical protein